MAQTNAAAAKPSVFARLGKYFKDVRTELRRVNWPNRQQVISSSVVVVVTLIFFIFFTLVIDSAASWLFINVLANVGR
jgi:preprotein translocase subunit SecE